MALFMCVNCMSVTERDGWVNPPPCPDCGETEGVALENDDPLAKGAGKGPPVSPPPRAFHVRRVAPLSFAHAAYGGVAQEGQHQTLAEILKKPTPSEVPVFKEDGRVVQYTFYKDGEFPVVYPATLIRAYPDSTADIRVIWKHGKKMELSTIPFTLARSGSDEAQGRWSWK